MKIQELAIDQESSDDLGNGNGDELLFSGADFDESEPEAAATASTAIAPWKVLIVDDDKMVHDATRIALSGLTFAGRPLKLFNEYSGDTALQLMQQEPDIAVMLLDVVMENTNSGLEVVRRVRNEFGNRLVRIILRTGQPGYTPEQVVTAEYDINDYKEKSDLTRPKLISSVTLALRGYSDLLTIQSLATSKDTLERLVRDRTVELDNANRILKEEVVERKLGAEALRQMNEELERRNIELIAARFEADAAVRAKSVILSSISHELRTPLNAVLGYAQLLDMSTTLDKRDKEAVAIIHQSGGHLLALIDNMIDLSQIEAGEIELEMDSVSVRSVIQECSEQMEAKAAQSNVALRCVADNDATLRIDVDPARVHQIVLNLLSNAIKYNRPNGNVLTSCALQDGMVRIEVTDSGIGIAAENQAKIFNAFDRLGAEFGTIEGTGIGLIISKRLTEAMGGRIGFESVENSGSTFWVEFKPTTP